MRLVVLSCLCGALLTFSAINSAHATIIRWSDAIIDGAVYSTFLDTETRHTWLTFDNDYSAYNNHSPVDFEQSLTGTGYHLASISESQELFATNLGFQEIENNREYYGEVFYGEGDYSNGFSVFGVGRADEYCCIGLYQFLGYTLHVGPNYAYGYGEDGVVSTSQYWNNGVQLIRSDVAAVPLPGAVWLFLTGLGFMGIRAKFLQPKTA